MKKVQKTIDTYVRARGWHKQLPSDTAKSIMIEGAELLELFQWNNPSIADVKKDKEKMAEIRKELADVFIYCFNMAVVLGIDAEKAVLDKLAHAKKKYPAKLMQLGGDEYLRIKKEHRKNKKK